MKNQKATEDSVGSKWSLTGLKQHYQANRIPHAPIFAQINDIVVKTLICVEPHMVGGCHKNGAFELYGFDILIDSELKPWLLEVNIQPSLSASSPLDRRIKYT